MTLFSQKYANNIRQVSGTVTVYQDDVVLNCVTAAAAVTVNLQEIPANYFSTQYKLYVKDYSNLSATNNITINAPTGFTINGGASITINSNGGSVIIRIVNNNSYIATYSYSTAGGTAGHIIQEEGTSLTQRAKLNFVGNLVAATDDSVNDASVVTVSQPYLYASKLLQTAGTYYAISGAGVRSVVSGDVTTTYDSKVESGITGFDISTGVWTVPATGYYSVGAKMTTRISETDIDSPTDALGAAWMTLSPTDGGVGFIGIGIIVQRVAGGGLTKFMVCSNKQAITNNISDVNIECTAVEFPFQSGDLVSVYVINKTDHAIVGIPARALTANCYIDFSAKY